MRGNTHRPLDVTSRNTFWFGRNFCLLSRMASQRGQYYETQYFHGQNLIIAWVKSFLHGQNHLCMGKIILAWANSFLAWAIWFEHEEISFGMGKFIVSIGKFICAWSIPVCDDSAWANCLLALANSFVRGQFPYVMIAHGQIVCRHWQVIWAWALLRGQLIRTR